MKKNRKDASQFEAFSSALKIVLAPEAKARVDADKKKRKRIKNASVSGHANREKS